jgi:hypothetical protein
LRLAINRLHRVQSREALTAWKSNSKEAVGSWLASRIEAAIMCKDYFI